MIVSKVTYRILIMLQVLVLIVERLCPEIKMDLLIEGTNAKVIT